MRINQSAVSSTYFVEIVRDKNSEYPFAEEYNYTFYSDRCSYANYPLSKYRQECQLDGGKVDTDTELVKFVMEYRSKDRMVITLPVYQTGYGLTFDNSLSNQEYTFLGILEVFVGGYPYLPDAKSSKDMVNDWKNKVSLWLAGRCWRYIIKNTAGEIVCSCGGFLQPSYITYWYYGDEGTPEFIASEYAEQEDDQSEVYMEMCRHARRFDEFKGLTRDMFVSAWLHRAERVLLTK